MMDQFTPIPATHLKLQARVHDSTQAALTRVTAEHPALAVMTDFTHIAPVMVGSEVNIEEANRRMIEHSVRLLLVVNSDRVLLGVITTTDILGEKPLQIVQERHIKHHDIAVSDVMTRSENIEVIQMRDVLRSRVGNVVATLHRAQRQHAVVVEPSDNGYAFSVRGLFSASQIARQLGAPVQVGDVARTFAEIEEILNHHNPNSNPVH